MKDEAFWDIWLESSCVRWYSARVIPRVCKDTFIKHVADVTTCWLEMRTPVQWWLPILVMDTNQGYWSGLDGLNKCGCKELGTCFSYNLTFQRKSH